MLGSRFATVLMMLLLALLTGCQSTSGVSRAAFAVSEHDAMFPEYPQVEVESAADIFALGPEALQFVREQLRTIRDPWQRSRTLVAFLFDQHQLDINYENQANTVANQTFMEGTANCLSLTILTYALAKEAGIPVKFRDVQVPEFWLENGDYSLLNGHINLRLYPKDRQTHINSGRSQVNTAGSMTVDFRPFLKAEQLPATVLTKAEIVSFFYNNKGATAMLNRDYDKAYAYFRAALTSKAQLPSTWSNLGYLLRLRQNYSLAEQAYLNALALQPNNRSALENLAKLYNRTDRTQEGSEILQRLARVRQDNPYYHYKLGERAYQAQSWQQALTHYRRAVQLQPKQHEFYFGQAKSYFALGQMEQGTHYLKLAKKYAQERGDRSRYHHKLSLLAGL